MSLKEFVEGLHATASAAAGSDSPGAITLVCGNEAADADSIVTALLYAYLLHQEAPGLVFPLIQCQREDIQLRNETVLLLRRCGVHDSLKLLFVEDAVAQSLLPKASQVVLTDHNAATGAFLAVEALVSEIIDHHEDLGKHPQVVGEKRIVAFENGAALVASACTLVAERFLAHVRGLALLEGDSSAVARALLGVILIDSVNLDPAAKKVTPRDKAAAAELAKFARDSQQELFQQLSDAKFDEECWQGLTLKQCLRYDFKAFKAAGYSVGLSSVLCPLASIRQKDGWPAYAVEEAKKYDLFGVMVNARLPDRTFSRELALLGKDGKLLDAAVAFLTGYEGGLLKLEPFPATGSEDGCVRVFAQKNLAASRKQVAPAFLAFFEAAAKEQG